jgi:hypothetical protein
VEEVVRRRIFSPLSASSSKLLVDIQAMLPLELTTTKALQLLLPFYKSTMSTPDRPSTPSKKPEIPATPVGKWKHPQLDEIYRRQNASNFSDRNVKKILYNVGGLFILWVVGRGLWRK